MISSPHEEKVAVYDAVDILPICENFPGIADELKGLPVFYASGYLYLVRHTTWEQSQELFTIISSGGDPRCDQYRMSQMLDVGSFEPNKRPPVGTRQDQS
jgi:hypothetical protein